MLSFCDRGQQSSPDSHYRGTTGPEIGPPTPLATGQEKGYIATMKKTFLYLAFCLAFCLVLPGSGTGAEDRAAITPLPDDVKIESPAPGIIPEVANLSGVWQGDLEVC